MENGKKCHLYEIRMIKNAWENYTQIFKWKQQKSTSSDLTDTIGKIFFNDAEIFANMQFLK